MRRLCWGADTTPSYLEKPLQHLSVRRRPVGRLQSAAPGSHDSTFTRPHQLPAGERDLGVELLVSVAGVVTRPVGLLVIGLALGAPAPVVHVLPLTGAQAGAALLLLLHLHLVLGQTDGPRPGAAAQDVAALHTFLPGAPLPLARGAGGGGGQSIISSPIVAGPAAHFLPLGGGGSSPPHVHPGRDGHPLELPPPLTVHPEVLPGLDVLREAVRLDAQGVAPASLGSVPPSPRQAGVDRGVEVAVTELEAAGPAVSGQQADIVHTGAAVVTDILPKGQIAGALTASLPGLMRGES